MSASIIQFTFLLVMPTRSASIASCAPRPGRNVPPALHPACALLVSHSPWSPPLAPPAPLPIPPLVRRLRSYCGGVRLLTRMHHRLPSHLHEPASCMGKTEGQPDCSSLTRALGQTCRPHSHRPAGCLHSRSIAPRSQPCRGRPRIRKPQRVVTVLPTIGHPPHEPRIGRPWCAPFRGRGPASASRRKRTMAPRGWFATGAHRAPSATTLSASPSWPGSSDRDGRHDRPGSAPAGTASRTRRTSRPTVI
jgi:hypothetical protein